MVSDVSVGIIPKMKMNVTVHSPLFRGVFPHILCGVFQREIASFCDFCASVIIRGTKLCLVDSL